jgi:hypothetical protein
MGCTCVRPNHEHLFNDFIKAIRVKTLSPSDLAFVLKNKKLKFDLLFKNNLINPDQEESHGPYYKEIYSLVESDLFQKSAFYTSLLLLCQKDIPALKKGLRDLSSHFDDQIRVDVITNILLMDRKLLGTILKYNVKQVSVYIIKHVSSQSSDKNQFEKHFNNIYNESTVDSFVGNMLADYKDEYVNMDLFLNDKIIDTLSDDHGIRIELEKIAIANNK